MTAADYAAVCRFVRERSAVVLGPGKEYLVETRLAPVARQLGLPSLAALVGRLGDADIQTRVVEAMVTTETSFFRDSKPFDALRDAVLPELVRARQAERRLRVWCAAASTGQEPYSVALLLRERFPELAGWDVSILATDLSADVLKKARSGRYTEAEASRGLPARLRARYFRRDGAEWELADDVRRAVAFRELNLARPWPALPPMDLILLRNVMIYFDAAAKSEVLARAARLLRPDGYLLLGGAETTLGLSDEFRREEVGGAGFYRRGGGRGFAPPLHFGEGVGG